MLLPSKKPRKIGTTLQKSIRDGISEQGTILNNTSIYMSPRKQLGPLETSSTSLENMQVRYHIARFKI